MPATAQSSDFHDVDGSGRAPQLIAEMARVAADPLTQRYLVQSLDRLRLIPGHCIADVGCGSAPDLANLCDRVGPTGRVVLIDHSDNMLREARARIETLAATGRPQIEVIECPAHKIALPDNSVDAARFVRVVQHLADPEGSIKEAARVLKPNGRFFAADPIWPTLAITGEDQETAQRIAQSASFRVKNWVGIAKLPSLLAAHGIIVDGIDQITRSVTDYQEAVKFYSIPERLDNLVDRGELSREVADKWMEESQRDSQNGRFFCSLTLWIVEGRKAEIAPPR